MRVWFTLLALAGTFVAAFHFAPRLREAFPRLFGAAPTPVPAAGPSGPQLRLSFRPRADGQPGREAWVVHRGGAHAPEKLGLVARHGGGLFSPDEKWLALNEHGERPAGVQLLAREGDSMRFAPATAVAEHPLHAQAWRYWQEHAAAAKASATPREAVRIEATGWDLAPPALTVGFFDERKIASNAPPFFTCTFQLATAEWSARKLPRWKWPAPAPVAAPIQIPAPPELKTTPAPPVTSAEKLTSAEELTNLRTFIRAHLAAENWRDLDRLMRDYDGMVQYREEGLMTRDQLRRSRRAFYQRWSFSRETLVEDDGPGGPIQLRELSAGAWEARFRTRFEAKNPSRRQASGGLLECTWRLRRSGTGYLITHEAARAISREEPPRRPRGEIEARASRSPDAAEAMPGERYPETRLRYLSEPDIAKWSDDELHYAINEMHARHGAYSRDPDYVVQFSRMSWYRPLYGLDFSDVAQTRFSPIERLNLRLLLSARARRGVR